MYSNNHYHNFNPYNNQYLQARNSTDLVTDIQKAINGEYSAVACYAQLAEMAPTLSIRDQILEIKQDEQRHLDEFSRIYLNLTGRKPTPQFTEGCPNSYFEGLEYAFKDEQETVDFYLDTADKAQDILTKKVLRRAASDEQNHAVWFLFFMQKMQANSI